jgi:hypothetical protein
MSTFFKRMRVEWIKEMLLIYGYVNREHVMRKFEVSVQQSSHDLKSAAQEHPAMQYNWSTKRYEIGGLDGSD